MLTNFQTEVLAQDGKRLYAKFFLLSALNYTGEDKGPTFEDIEIRYPIIKIVKATEKDAEFAFSAKQLCDMQKIYNDAPPMALHEDVLSIKKTLEAAAAKQPEEKESE